MDFAPYQSSPPENGRPFSPDTAASPRASTEQNRRPFSPANYSYQQGGAGAGAGGNRASPALQHPQPQRSWQPSSLQGGYASPGPAGDGFGGAREGVSEFDTSLGIRLDYEACLAYLAFPPLGAIFLLIAERNSDYVRFHAWQSALLFTCVMIFHLVFSWSKFMSWFIFVGDLVLIAGLTLRAYQDADTLDRFEVPVVGRIASRILDDE